MLICHCDIHGIFSELSSCLFTVCDAGNEVECILVTVTSYISPHVLLGTLIIFCFNIAAFIALHYVFFVSEWSTK